MVEKSPREIKKNIKEKNDFFETLVTEKEDLNSLHLEVSNHLKKSQKVVNILLKSQEKYLLTIKDSDKKIVVTDNINKIKIILEFYDFFITTFKKTANNKKALFKKTTRFFIFKKLILLLLELKIPKNLNHFRKQFSLQVNKMAEKIIFLNEKYHYLRMELESFQEISLIKLFYELGIDFNQMLDHPIEGEKDEIKAAPLHFAVFHENQKLIAAILSWGFDVNVADELGSTALYIASYANNLAIVKYLLANGANINVLAADVSILETVIEENNYETLRLLIENGADVNIKNSQGETPIFQAIRLEKLLAIKLLIENGADINIRDKNDKLPIYLAIETNNIKIIQLLIENGAISSKDNNAMLLMVTVMISTPTVLNLLLSNGLDLNLVNELNSDTLLLHAVISCEKNNFAKLLVEKGININSKDKLGQTPLHLAVIKENMPIFKLLLKHNADINIKDKRGFHALHFAALNNDINTVNFLQKNGADINICNNLGQTPLHLAIINNNKEVAEILTTLGANLYIRDSKGQTPFYLMQKKKTFDFLKKDKN